MENVLMNTKMNLTICFVFICFASAWAQDKNTLSSALMGREVQLDTSKQKNNVIRLDGPKVKVNPPLCVFIADGKRLQEKDSIKTAGIFNSIDREWIQSMKVLNRPSETGKYGSLGKDGVVLVEFKKGTLAKLPDTLRGRFKP